MKKYLVIVVLLTLGLLGCNSSKTLPISSEKDINLSSDQVNGYITSQLNISLEPEYRFSYVSWIDDERIVVAEERYEDQNGTSVPHNKIFLYNTIEKTKNLIFDGILYGNIRVKYFEPSIITLLSDHKYIVLNITEQKIIKEVTFPQDWFETDVSPDGNQAVYCMADGLHISDLNDISSSTLIFKLQQARGPVTPRWSTDNKIIFNNYSDGKVTVNIIDSHLIKYKEFTITYSDRVMSYWLPDNTGFVVYQTNGQSQYLLNIVKTSSDIVTNIQEDGPIQVQDLDGNIFLYTAFYNNNWNMIRYDLKTSQKTIISQRFLAMYGANISPSRKYIVFIGAVKPNDQQGLFMINRQAAPRQGGN